MRSAELDDLGARHRARGFDGHGLLQLLRTDPPGDEVPIVAEGAAAAGAAGWVFRAATIPSCDIRIAVAARRLPQALGRADGLRARLRRDPDGRPPRGPAGP